MKKSKLLGLLALGVLLLPSCGPSNGPGETTSGDGGDPTVYPDYERTPGEKDSWEYLKDENGNVEEYTVEWYVNQSSFAWSSYGQDRISQIIKEKTGVKIKFITPVTDDGQKLSTMIAGNKLPDLVSIQCWYQECSQLAQQGYLYPLNGLIERWAPSLEDRLQMDMWNYFKEGDGFTYGFPSFAYSNKYVSDSDKLEPNGALLVRKDWYEEAVAAGHDMTTPDSFIAGCEYIKGKYTDCIPFQLAPFANDANQSITWLQQYFNTAFEDSEGNYVDVRTQDNYKDMLRFLNECTSKGIIRSANFSEKYDQIKTNIARQKVFASIVTPQDYQAAFLSCHESGVDYVPLVLRNYKNEAPVLQDLSGNGFLLTMVTKNCKRPDKVIKLLDFLYSEEGQRLVAFGVEGETWNWTDETKTAIEWTERYLSAVSKANAEDAAWLDGYGLYAMTLMMNLAYINKFKPENGMTENDIYITNLKKPLLPYSYNFKPSFLKHDSGHKDFFSISTKAKKVDTKWVLNLVEMLRADNDEWEDVYNNAINYAMRQGLDDVIEFYSKSYENTKNLLGIEFGYPTHQPGYVEPTTGPNGDPSYCIGGANG